MKILYVINSPCWKRLHRQALIIQICFQMNYLKILLFYFNLMKFGLVNKVIIFVQDKRWRNDPNIKKIVTEYGELEIRHDTNKFQEINSDKEMNFVYCWSNIEECSKIKNKFIIVDNQFHGYIRRV